MRRLPVAAANLLQEQWILPLASGFLLFGAINGWRTGRATLFFRATRRSEDPMLFWISVALGGVLGVTGLVMLILKIG
jgi:hypothetical protein